MSLDDGEAVELEGPGGAVRLPVKFDADVPEGSVFVPYAYAEVELNRLGAPTGSGLRVKVRKAAMVTA
jgi:predicted molibdopterin-dependent oxidoreductase YjgC